MAAPCVARRRGRAGAPSSRARRAARRPSRSPRSAPRAARRPPLCTTASPTTSISDGCSTSNTQSVNACTIRLPAVTATIRCSAAARRLGRQRLGAAPAATVLGVGAVGGLAGQRHLEQHPRLEQLLRATPRASRASSRSRPRGCGSCPGRRSARRRCRRPGPLLARIRLPLASSLSASRSVGRLTPNSAARSSSRPRKSPGPSPSRWMKCWISDATCSLAPRIRVRRGDALIGPPSRAGPSRAGPCPRSAGSTPGPTGTTRTRSPSCWRITSCSVRAVVPRPSSTSSLTSSMPPGSV